MYISILQSKPQKTSLNYSWLWQNIMTSLSVCDRFSDEVSIHISKQVKNKSASTWIYQASWLLSQLNKSLTEEVYLLLKFRLDQSLESAQWDDNFIKQSAITSKIFIHTRFLDLLEVQDQLPTAKSSAGVCTAQTILIFCYVFDT